MRFPIVIITALLLIGMLAPLNSLELKDWTLTGGGTNNNNLWGGLGQKSIGHQEIISLDGQFTTNEGFFYADNFWFDTIAAGWGYGLKLHFDLTQQGGLFALVLSGLSDRDLPPSTFTLFNIGGQAVQTIPVAWRCQDDRWTAECRVPSLRRGIYFLSLGDVEAGLCRRFIIY